MMVYYGKIDPVYFWDEMTISEANVILDCINEENKFKWEMARLDWFYIGQWDRKVIKKPKDLIEFTWEKSDSEVEKEDIEVTKQRLLEMMNSLD